MIEFFKKEGKKYATLTHEEWGAVNGMIMGLALGIFVVTQDNYFSVDWPFIGKLNFNNDFFDLMMKITIAPLSSGLFAALFSKMGHGIDVVTNKETMISLIYKTFNPPRPELEPLIPPIGSSSGSSNYSNPVRIYPVKNI